MTPAQAVSAKLEKANEGTSHRMSVEPEGCVEVAASDQIGLFRVVPIPRDSFGSQTGSDLTVSFPMPCHTHASIAADADRSWQPLDGMQPRLAPVTKALIHLE